ncbi:MAG: MATE family efflux transporter [Prevotellaceae bacterium]|jgi:putative MATE family efflux protein|nr:MATE family efflux transporter [Prevotellaceae bacterium]
MAKLTSGNVTIRIFQFALPMLIGNVFQQMYNIVDAIVVGKYVGKEALSGVLASSQIIMAVISLIIGVGIGGSVVIAQFFGAKNKEKVQITSDTITLFLLVASIILGVFGIIFCDEILSLVQLPPEAAVHAKPFLQIFFAGLFTVFGFNATSSIMRGVGDSKTPLYALIITTVLNVFLDLLFVITFKLGAGGAALATVVSQLVSWLFIIFYVNKKIAAPIKFNIFHTTFDWGIFKQCVRIGLPSGIQQAFVMVGMVALFGIINTFGVDVSAGYGAAMRIDTFAGLPAMNFSAALSIFVAQNIGAERFDRIKKGLLSTLLMSGGISIAVSALALLLRYPLIGLFTDALNEEVIHVGSQYLVIVCAFYLVFSSMFVMNGVLRGAGATLAPMIFSFVGLWGIRVPVAYYLSRPDRLGYMGVFWSIPAAWFSGLALCTIYYFSGKWKNKTVIKKVQVAAVVAEVTE